jgi:hypothetical protein
MHLFVELIIEKVKSVLLNVGLGSGPINLLDAVRGA